MASFVMLFILLVGIAYILWNLFRYKNKITFHKIFKKFTYKEKRVLRYLIKDLINICENDSEIHIKTKFKMSENEFKNFISKLKELDLIEETSQSTICLNKKKLVSIYI